MQTIDPVVAYCMQISMYNFTGEAFVIVCIIIPGCYNFGLLSVYREIVDSVRIFNNQNQNIFPEQQQQQQDNNKNKNNERFYSFLEKKLNLVK